MTVSKLKLTSPQQKNGAIYEQLACQYLQSQGLVLIAQNWLQPKVGEIDLIMIESGKTWDTLVFIEVRSRKVGKHGDAITSVTKAKQKKLIKTARLYLQAHPHLQNHECRFDVLAFSQEIIPSGFSQPKYALQKDCLQSDYINPHGASTLLTNRVMPLSAHLDTSFEWIQGAFVANAWA